MTKTKTHSVSFSDVGIAPDQDTASILQRAAGPLGKNLLFVEKILDARIVSSPSGYRFEAPANAAEKVRAVLTQMLRESAHGRSLSEDDLNAIVLETGSEHQVGITTTGKPIRPITKNQKLYVERMNKNDISLAVGPAGTGKTYLAVSTAIEYLRDRKVRRIILTRPVIEAGERLGYLPGGFQEKINPYLRPLFDAIYNQLSPEQLMSLIEQNVIELAPLAYMRGRTFNDAFVILDEGQNTTPQQMLMFLTRLGEGSRMVVTGDVTQVDLPPKTKSGLVVASKKLKNVDGIAITTFDRKDVVRHDLVTKIITAFEKK